MNNEKNKETTTVIEPEVVEAEFVEVVEEAVAEPVIITEEENGGVVPLTSASLTQFKEEEREAIVALANAIDVTDFSKVASYASVPLEKTFRDASAIIKDFSGTSTDHEVVEMVRKLSEQASKSQEDFNLVISKPSFVEGLLMKISSKMKEKNDADVKYKAISCYKLLEQLRDSCETWIQNLEENRGKIIESAYSDRDVCYELEEYIVAGHVALERLESELVTLENKWKESGLIEDKLAYENYKRGLDNFKLKLTYLEKSRAAGILSIGQLGLQVRANESIQLAVRSQKDHSMALAVQQIRNALTDKRNREALEGQKSITKLNDELLKKVSEGVALTSKEAEEILINGVYSVEAAVQAVQTVKTACADIIKVREQLVPKIEQEMEKVKKLVEEISPVVSEIKVTSGLETDTSKPSTAPKGNLSF